MSSAILQSLYRRWFELMNDEHNPRDLILGKGMWILSLRIRQKFYDFEIFQQFEDFFQAWFLKSLQLLVFLDLFPSVNQGGYCPEYLLEISSVKDDIKLDWSSLFDVFYDLSSINRSYKCGMIYYFLLHYPVMPSSLFFAPLSSILMLLLRACLTLVWV